MDYTDYQLAGIADQETGFFFSPTVQPPGATYQGVGSPPVYPGVRYDKITPSNRLAIGFAYEVTLFFAAHSSLTYPLTISGDWTIEVYITETLPIPGAATLLFKQIVNVSLEIDSHPPTDSNVTWTETVSTLVVNGQAVAPGDFIHYLDNGNTIETVSDNGTVNSGTTDCAKTWLSAPYALDIDSPVMVKVTYNFPYAATNIPGIVANVSGFVRQASVFRLRGEYPYLGFAEGRDGSFMSAVRVPTASPAHISAELKFYQFAGSISSRTEKSTLPDRKHPLLFQDGCGVWRLVSLHEDNAVFQLYRSEDNGLTWIAGDTLFPGDAFSFTPAWGGAATHLTNNATATIAIPLSPGNLLQMQRSQSPYEWSPFGRVTKTIEQSTYIFDHIFDVLHFWTHPDPAYQTLYISNGFDRCYLSEDLGLNWVYWTPLIWDRDEYYSPHINSTLESGGTTCAIKKNTLPAEVWFRYSEDGINWTRDPVLVGTLGNAYHGGTYRACRVLQSREDGSLWICNGHDRLFRSQALGLPLTWEALL